MWLILLFRLDGDEERTCCLHRSLALGLPQRSEQSGALPPPGEQAVQQGGEERAEGHRGKCETGEHHAKLEDRRWRTAGGGGWFSEGRGRELSASFAPPLKLQLEASGCAVWRNLTTQEKHVLCRQTTETHTGLCRSTCTCSGRAACERSWSAQAQSECVAEERRARGGLLQPQSSCCSAHPRAPGSHGGWKRTTEDLIRLSRRLGF